MGRSSGSAAWLRAQADNTRRQIAETERSHVEAARQGRPVPQQALRSLEVMRSKQARQERSAQSAAVRERTRAGAREITETQRENARRAGRVRGGGSAPPTPAERIAAQADSAGRTRPPARPGNERAQASAALQGDEHAIYRYTSRRAEGQSHAEALAGAQAWKRDMAEINRNAEITRNSRFQGLGSTPGAMEWSSDATDQRARNRLEAAARAAHHTQNADRLAARASAAERSGAGMGATERLREAEQIQRQRAEAAARGRETGLSPAAERQLRAEASRSRTHAAAMGRAAPAEGLQSKRAGSVSGDKGYGRGENEHGRLGGSRREPSAKTLTRAGLREGMPHKSSFVHGANKPTKASGYQKAHNFDRRPAKELRGAAIAGGGRAKKAAAPKSGGGGPRRRDGKGRYAK